MLLALGVVFGDIGTSPLYAFETALAASNGISGAAVGVASLIVWTLFLVVTLKYCVLVMRAGYHGEGGVFALMALLKDSGWLTGKGRWLAVFLVVGAALLFGDGAITPAVSVLSAVEGMEAVNPGLAPFAMPAAAAILTLLFLVQSLGTGRLGAVFGPVMLLWFLMLGGIGAAQIVQAPVVLTAINPLHGLSLLAEGGWSAVAIVGAVVLAVTGAEALFADMGHFGRPAIFRAWKFIAFPALALNYLGQAAYVLRAPTSASDPNLFFLLVPEGPLRAAAVVLATGATVIASQALISGVFSLSSQAIDLGYLPRFFVRHTSDRSPGQIYIPLVNVLLGISCLMLVVGFRSSAALANAYGIAVTGAMIVTSVAFGAVVLQVWRWPRWKAVLLLAALLAVDLPLFLASLSKLLDGALVPVLLAAGVAVVMLTWRRGRDLVHSSMKFGAVGLDELAGRLQAGEFARIDSTQVFIVRKPIVDNAIACILEQNRRIKVVGNRLVILLLNPSWANAHSDSLDLELKEYPGGLWVLNAEHGFMVEPNVPRIMRSAASQSNGRFVFHTEETFFVVAHELVLSSPKRMMPPWQRHLFAFMSRNVLPGPDYLGIPPERLLVYNWMLRV